MVGAGSCACWVGWESPRGEKSVSPSDRTPPFHNTLALNQVDISSILIVRCHVSWSLCPRFTFDEFTVFIQFVSLLFGIYILIESLRRVTNLMRADPNAGRLKLVWNHGNTGGTLLVRLISLFLVSRCVLSWHFEKFMHMGAEVRVGTGLRSSLSRSKCFCFFNKPK